MLSKKTRYALMALIKLASEYGNGTIQINEIAESERIPQRFLENILLELKKIGILGSRLGKNGGYFLLKHPDEINLADLVRHFEGTISMIYCVSEKAYQPCEFCKNESTCKVRHLFKDIRDYTFSKLQNTKLSHLVDDGPAGEPEYSI